MDVRFDTDEWGRLLCTVAAGDASVLITSSDAFMARTGLLAALEDARANGYGECLWPEAVGEYKWMFRRHLAELTVVVLWSSGTLTGWQHVLRETTDFETFTSRVEAEFAILG
jgi:hypothetical protein